MAKRIIHWLAGLMVCIGLVACTADETLPTLAELNTPTPEISAGVTSPQPVTDGRATLPPSWTPSITPTAEPSITPSPTITVTPSTTITDTPTVTNTPLPTIPLESRPVGELIIQAAQATILPTDFVVPQFDGADVSIASPLPPANIQPIAPSNGNAFTPTPAPTLVPLPTAIPIVTCAFFPAGGFGTIFSSNADIGTQIGCPVGNPPSIIQKNAAIQTFQNGIMIWIEGEIYVLDRLPASYRIYPDSFTEGIDPNNSTETAPDGLVVPVRGFLKVWSSFPDVRTTLGYGTVGETSAQATILDFDRGQMIWLNSRTDTFIFTSSDGITGTWRSIVGSF